MCGILGFLAGLHDAESALHVMGERLRHRGPDGEGFVRIPRAQMGHRRLAVIDLTETGSQPMWDATKSLCIVFNGEIYNFRELRQECLDRGAHFCGTSDTEVILNLFLLDGMFAFSRLDGMFAFCLFDTRTETAYLVRDPMGVKPLYYADGDGGIYFASELSALVEAGVVSREIDELALRAYLRLDYVPSPLCLIRGVRKLNGGEVLEIGRSSRRLGRFADWSTEHEASLDEAGALDLFDRLMRDSVSRQLVADVPVGVFLSGGVDSSIVAAIAAEQTRGSVHTFSIGFEEREFDESPFFDDVAERIGSIHHRKIVSASDTLEVVPRMAAMTGEPIADGSILPTYLLCRFAREHVTVALSGDGADELFGGYPTYRFGRTADLLSRLPSGMQRLLELATDTLPVNLGDLTPAYKAWKFAHGLDRDPVARHHRWMGTFAPESLPSLLLSGGTERDDELDILMASAATGVAGRGRLEQLMRTDQRFYLQDQVLVKTDRASMANSLEVRPPFLSEPVVRFARSMPADLKIRSGGSKYLLRKWLARRFPPRLSRRAKKGFGAPLAKWFCGDLRELVGDVLSESVVRRQGLFRFSTVNGLVQEHWAGRRDRRKEIFNLLTLSLWIDSLGADRR